MKARTFLTCAALIGLAMAPLTASAGTAAPPVAQIVVAGEGRVEVTPDLATLTLGVSSRGETAAAALAANSGEMAKILDALTKAGIAQRDVQTSSVNLNPVWENGTPDRAPQISGYEVSNQVTVRIRALPSLGEVMDGLVAVGVNQLYGLTFGLSEPEPQMDKARAASVEDARRKASLLAEAAGLALGEILQISEGHASQGGPMPVFARASADGGVPVAEGALTISATTTITFGLVSK